MTISARILAATLIALAGQADAESPKERDCGPVYVAPDRVAKSVEAGKIAIARRLKDPGSARFGPVFHAKVWCADGAREFVCGKVNSRNSFGAYGGDKIWLVAFTRDGAVSWSEEEKGDLKTAATMWTAVEQCFEFGK